MEFCFEYRSNIARKIAINKNLLEFEAEGSKLIHRTNSFKQGKSETFMKQIITSLDYQYFYDCDRVLWL